MRDLDAHAWPLERVGELLEAVAHRAGFGAHAAETPVPPTALAQAGRDATERWLTAAGDVFGVEVEPVDAEYGDAEAMIRGAGPALLEISREPKRFLGILGARGGRARVLCCDGRVRHVSIERLRARVCADAEAPHLPRVEALLADAGVPARRRARARRLFLSEGLAGMRIGGCYVVRLPAGAPSSPRPGGRAPRGSSWWSSEPTSASTSCSFSPGR